MQASSSQSRLRTIVSMDVCASTAATYQNEPETIAQIQQQFSLLKTLCETFQGEVIASMGDGFVLAFPNNQNALACVCSFQQQILQANARQTFRQPIAYRTGIHLGEVALGSELNARVRLIADKLQHCSEPNGICLSRAVYDSVRPKFQLPFQDAGLHQIEGLPYSMRLYHLSSQHLAHPVLQPMLNAYRETSSQLMVVVFTSIEGYETKLLQQPQQLREYAQRDFLLMTQRYRSLNRKIIKSMGQGLLLVFSSAIQAVTWALNIQKLLQQQAESLPPQQVLQHQIGIHLGDVELIQQDIAGNTVNLTARLNLHAPPDGICLSTAVYDSVESLLSLPLTYDDRKIVEVKGISHPLSIYPFVVSTQEAQHSSNSLKTQANLTQTASTIDQSRPVACTNAQELIELYQAGYRNFSDQVLNDYNLARTSLTEINLSQCKLQRVNLRSANLSQANLSRADLFCADLANANLNRVYANCANLEGADLSRSQLRNAYLSNANLEGSNLCGADLTGAKLAIIQLSKAQVDEKTIYPDGKTRSSKSFFQRIWRSP